MSFSLKLARAGIVFGAGRGIGLAFVRSALRLNSELTLWATYRDSKRSSGLLSLAEMYSERLKVRRVDPCDEEDLALTRDWLSSGLGTVLRKLDFVLIANGILHNERVSPEKSLRHLNTENLIEVFRVNSFITPLVAKHFSSLLSRSSTSLFAALSARVGSIEDNEIGGWYGYRASKASLNMFLKTIAIELNRSGWKTAVAAIHPGTTKTDLSKPYLGGTKYRVWEPDEAAINIINVINQLSPSADAVFKAWDGTDIPW